MGEETGNKTLIGKALGGKCDQKISADTWNEMVKAMSKHVAEQHPDVAKGMEKMYNEDPRKWGREMKPKFDAAPEEKGQPSEIKSRVLLEISKANNLVIKTGR